MENKTMTVKWFLNLFKPKCPNCKSPMSSSFFDIKYDNLVYTCPKCKKQWI